MRLSHVLRLLLVFAGGGSAMAAGDNEPVSQEL
jgi:hypothetical protein